MTDKTEYGQFPLKEFLGMELVRDDPGVGTATVEINDKHHNPNGVVHGAVLSHSPTQRWARRQ